LASPPPYTPLEESSEDDAFEHVQPEEGEDEDGWTVLPGEARVGRPVHRHSIARANKAKVKERGRVRARKLTPQSLLERRGYVWGLDNGKGNEEVEIREWSDVDEAGEEGESGEKLSETCEEEAWRRSWCEWPSLQEAVEMGRRKEKVV
jgi:hypothetical protein